MLHIDVPSRAEIDRLIDHRGSPALSIYLPTTPRTQEAQGDRIALKNLLREGLAQIAAAGADIRTARPIEAAVEEVIADDAFWAEQANSLALFVTPSKLRSFRLANHLAAQVEVSDRFHLKPLLRAVTFPQNAFVLAIGMGGVRLIEVSADLPPHEVKVPGLPRDAAHAVSSRSHLAKRGDMVGGEGGSEGALLTRYARAVDSALRPMLAGHERPLILAAAEPMAAVFRAVCSYPHLAEEGLGGSADHTPDHALAEAARGVLDGLHGAQVTDLAALFARRAGQGRATADIAMAARAATFGAVDTLIVDMDSDLPGTVGEEDGTVRFAAAADGATYSITDEIARRALRHGARVLSARRADIPGGGDLAAVLRYPI
jgi:hypothetical protein